MFDPCDTVHDVLPCILKVMNFTSLSANKMDGACQPWQRHTQTEALFGFIRSGPLLLTQPLALRLKISCQFVTDNGHKPTLCHPQWFNTLYNLSEMQKDLQCIIHSLDLLDWNWNGKKYILYNKCVVQIIKGKANLLIFHLLTIVFYLL